MAATPLSVVSARAALAESLHCLRTHRMSPAYSSTWFVAFLRFGLIASVLVLSSCARLTSIYRHQDIDSANAQLTSIDAKQRVILSAPSGRNDKPATRFCAEPPPDVFTAIATSFGAKANVGQGKDASAAAELLTSISENAATIERSQTINILRESMYRNCERYLSGAIEESEFIVQAARDQQLIIQVLAIEQITGATRRQSTALTTVAQAISSGTTAETILAVDNAGKSYSTKLAAATKAAADAAELPPKGACGEPIDESAPPSGVTEEVAKAKNVACQAATAAQNDAKLSKTHYDLLADALSKQSELSAEAKGALVNAAQASSTVSSSIASQVVEIVKQSTAFDEIGMTCVVWARKVIDSNSTLPEEFEKLCMPLIETMSKSRQADIYRNQYVLDMEAKQIFESISQETATNASLVWNVISKAENRSKAWNELEAKTKLTALPEEKREKLIGATSLAEFERVFGQLPAIFQAAIAEAAKQ